MKKFLKITFACLYLAILGFLVVDSIMSIVVRMRKCPRSECMLYSDGICIVESSITSDCAKALSATTTLQWKIPVIAIMASGAIIIGIASIINHKKRHTKNGKTPNPPIGFYTPK